MQWRAGVDFKALFFDFDGVLADTEEGHYLAFARALSEEGERLEREEYLSRYMHGDDASVFRMVAADRGLGWGGEKLAGLARRKGRIFLEWAGAEDRLYGGVRELVAGLAERLPLAVVSMAERREVELLLGRGGILDFFRTLICAGEVERSKPDPLPYQAGLAALNRVCGSAWGPGESVVVEDSAGGVQAGKGAGMRVLAMAHTRPRAELCGAGADEIVESIAELRRILLK